MGNVPPAVLAPDPSLLQPELLWPCLLPALSFPAKSSPLTHPLFFNFSAIYPQIQLCHHPPKRSRSLSDLIGLNSEIQVIHFPPCCCFFLSFSLMTSFKICSSPPDSLLLLMFWIYCKVLANLAVSVILAAVFSSYGSGASLGQKHIRKQWTACISHVEETQDNKKLEECIQLRRACSVCGSLIKDFLRCTPIQKSLLGQNNPVTGLGLIFLSWSEF